MKLKIHERSEIAVGRSLSGYIFGDTRGKFTDGEYVRTSTVLEINTEGTEIKTRNSTYEIERVSQDEIIALAVADQ